MTATKDLLKSRLPNQTYTESIRMSDGIEDWEEEITFTTTAYDVERGESEHLDGPLWEHYVYCRMESDWGDWYRAYKRFTSLGPKPPSTATILNDTNDWTLRESLT